MAFPSVRRLVSDALGRGASLGGGVVWVRAVGRRAWVGEGAAVGALLALIGVAAWELVVGGTMVGQDTAAFFYPIYAAMGERLGAGDIPGWNPHQFGGVPFAADPESGWGYVLAMLLFAVLPVAVAAKAWIVVHLALPSLATFALGRTLGIGPAGALVAAASYALSGLLYGRTVCCPAYSQMAAWVPPLILGVELALRGRSWLGRVAWWGVAGFALSQVIAAWIGQGTYYVLLALGGYVAYRTLVDPPRDRPASAWWARLGRLAVHGGAVLLIGFGLAAAAIVPRLAYHERTNLADGYTGALAWAAVLGGWTPSLAVSALLSPTLYYAGGATLALAVVAPLIAGRRHATPFFLLLSAAALVLASPSETALHRLLYATLPRFEELHRHWPERDMVVFVLGPAMLAGATVEGLGRWRTRPALLVLVGMLPVLGVLLLEDHTVPVSRDTDRAIAVAGLLVAAYAVLGQRWVRGAVPLLLAGVVVVDLLAAGRFVQANGPYGGLHEFDLDRYATAEAAAAFLRAQRQDGPDRFFGYDPGIGQALGGANAPYRFHFADPRAMALLLNNRATLLGLQDVQGYNPLQPRRFVEYMTALNRFAQEYHEANVYATGLDSPLLDLLNARYVVVPAGVPADRQDLQRLRASYPVVYEDAAVAVLENGEALPRSWIVHEARRVGPGEALPLLAGGAVDPRRVALVEEEPPALAPAVDPTTDAVSITDWEADRIEIRSRTDAPGLLVLSEPYDPDWRAYVDGERVEVLVANHLLRAVPVPAGEHAVELRYESRSLRTGMAISLGVIGLYAVLVAGLVVARRRPGRLEDHSAGAKTSSW